MKSHRSQIEDIEETEDAIFQRHQLNQVRQFLSQNEAPQYLIEAVDVALDDIERWISPAIETALGATASRKIVT